MTWTPHAPDALGQQWFPDREPAVQLQGAANAGGAKLRSSVTESVRALHVALYPPHGAATDGWEWEVYDLAALAGGGIATDDYWPGSDHTAVTAYGTTPGGPVTTPDLWQLVNIDPMVPGTAFGRDVPNETFISPIYGTAAVYTACLTGIGGAYTAGEHILGVRLSAKVQELAAESPHPAAVTFTPVLTYRGIRYRGRPQTYAGEAAEAYDLDWTWPACPWEYRSWNPEDLVKLDATDERAGIGFEISSTGTPANLPVIYQMHAEVDYAPTDPRVAVAVLPGPQARRAWNRLVLRDPADGAAADWAKAAGDEYLVVGRQRTGSGVVAWRYITGDDDAEPNGWTYGLPTVYPNGRLAGLDDGDTDALGNMDRAGAFALLLERADGALSADSQPYYTVNDDVSGVANLRHLWTHVHVGQQLTQELTPGSGVTVGWLRVLATMEAADGTDNLTVELIHRGTSTVLATVVFEPEQLGDRPTRFQVLEDYIGPVALAGGTQYALRFSCPAAQGAGWRVQVLSAGLVADPDPPPATVGTVTFGGATDRLQVGATEYSELDAAATVHSQPDAPTDLAVSVVAAADGVEVAELTWTPTAVAGGGGFRRYEVERSDGRTDWQLVATIEDEAADTWEDHESRAGEPSWWRMRVRRTDWSASDWSDSTSATVGMPNGCGYTFTSNDAQDRAQWYDDVKGDGTTSWDPIERVTDVELEGRDYAVAMRDLNDRGDEFEMTVFVAGRGASGGTPTEPAEPGRRVFDPLLVLAGNKKDPDLRAKVATPYICVRNHLGDRWFARLLTGPATQDEPSGTYLLGVNVREVTYTASAAVVPAEGS